MLFVSSIWIIFSIFREYDIRGKFPEELNKDTARRIGLSLGTYYNEKGVNKISLGHDCRLSSPDLNTALTKGLIESGMDVVDIGMVPTPLLYFSMFHLQIDGGIQITGSHNPPEYNGFKICLNKTTIHGEEIQKIRQICEEGKYNADSGSLEKISVTPSYLAYLRQNLIPGPVKRKVIIDAGNGVGGMVAPDAYADMGIEVEKLFCEPDGHFPNHHPDPTIPENLEHLISKVKEKSADLGIAFDQVNGEGDQGEPLFLRLFF